MPYQNSTSISKNATGQAVGGPCEVTALGILGGANAATVKVYDGSSQADTLRWGLGVAANTSDGVAFTGDSVLRFTKGVYIVVTGTTPDVFIAVKQPRANQIEAP